MSRANHSIRWAALVVSASVAATATWVCAAGTDKPAPQHRPEQDSREHVSLPTPMKEHMMANMRDHLAVINEIQAALAVKDFDRVEDLAEKRLGQSSFNSHGATHLGPHMPEGMRRVGNDMHRSASQLALKAKEGDLQAAIAGLAEVTSRCVACHATYRVN